MTKLEQGDQGEDGHGNNDKDMRYRMSIVCRVSSRVEWWIEFGEDQ